MRREWHEGEHIDTREQWWAGRDGWVKQLCVTEAGWRGWGTGWWVQRGMSAFDVGNTDQRQHQQRLQKTTSWVGYSPPPAWQMHMKEGYWDVCRLSLWEYRVFQKGCTIIQQLMRAYLTPMCRLIQRTVDQPENEKTYYYSFLAQLVLGSDPKVWSAIRHSATGNVAPRLGQYTQRCTKKEPTSSNPALHHLWCPTRGLQHRHTHPVRGMKTPMHTSCGD